MTSNIFVAVPYVIDDGPVDGRCHACHNDQHNRAVLVDAMGIAGVDNSVVRTFRYRVCARCGTLDLLLDPGDEAALYGDGYYSFEGKTPSSIERRVIGLRNRFELGGRGVFGRAISLVWPGPHHRAIRRLINETIGQPMHKSARILDVGCGAGKWLKELSDQGFTNLTGVDPFLPANATSGSVRLVKGDVQDIDGTFDLVTIHHAFEHIAEGETALRALKEKLGHNGVLIVRIPLGASYGWRKYGGYWVQLDAPRHMHLYSPAGMKALADRVGLETRDVAFDATSFMVTGSEATLAGMRPHTGQPIASLGTQGVFGWVRSRRIATLTNRLGTADQAAFYFTAKT
ncbi:MAG: class I SAM-dependent methyltransferase [Pseudomonadota bacterium]